MCVACYADEAMKRKSIAEAGIPILEIAPLEELAAEGAHEFALFGACIGLCGATAAPKPLG